MRLKQILVVLSGLLYSLGVGYVLRVQTLLITTLLSTGFNDDGQYHTEDVRQVSFLYLTRILATALGFLIIAIVMQIFGRKIAHIVLNISLIISLALYIIAKHISVIFLAQVIQGISHTGIIVEAIILSEYCHKKRRGIFMSLEKTAEWSGGLMCYLLGSWVSWRNVCLIGSVSPCVAIILTIFWPESPYFHAMKGQYEECEKSFRLLHGESKNPRCELRSLISVQQKKLEQENLHRRSMITNTFRKFLEKSFWKAFLIMAILILLHSVKYSYDSFFMFTANYDTSLYRAKNGELLIYIFMILASLLSCSIMLIERRSVLLIFGCLSILLLVLCSILAIAADSNRACQLLLSGAGLFYGFFINLSILPVCAILFGELYILEHRGIGVFTSGIVYVVLQIIHTSTSAFLVYTAGLGYTFLNYAWLTALCLTILFFILPETKNKTLQEIEHKLRGDKRPTVAETSVDNVEMSHLSQQEDKTEI